MSKGEKNVSNIDVMIHQMGWTRKQFAAEIGVSTPTVSDWCNHKKRPSVKNLEKMCKVLDCSSDYALDMAPLGQPIPGREPQPMAAAAHFDLEKLTPEGVERYNEYIQYLTERFSKEDE